VRGRAHDVVFDWLRARGLPGLVSYREDGVLGVVLVRVVEDADAQLLVGALPASVDGVPVRVAVLTPGTPAPQRVYWVPDQMPWPERLMLLGQLADEGAQDPTIRALADQLWAESGGDRAEFVGACMRIAQGVPYIPDPPGKDVFRDAPTVLREGDDCDGKVVLCCALLRADRRVRCAPVHIPQPWSSEDHLAVAVELGPGQGPYWADVTIPGARLGEHPWAALVRLGAPAGVYSIRPAGRAVYQPAGQAAPGADWCVPLPNLPAGSAPWLQCTDVAAGFVQVMIPAWADGWLAEAVRRTDARQLEALDGQPFEAQRAAVEAAWQALVNFFRCCNLPPLSSPTFRRVFDDTFGPGSYALFFAEDAVPVGPFGPSNGPGILAGAGGWMLDRVRAQWSLMGHTDRVPDGFNVRALMDARARLVTSYLGDPFNPAAKQGSDWRPGAFAYVGCAYYGQAQEDCNPYNWVVMNWHNPPQGTAAARPVWEVLSPLRWWLEYAGNLARALVEVGDAHAIVSEARVWVRLRNASEAQRVGMLGGAADLAAATVNIGPDVLDYAQKGPEITRARVALSSTLGIAAAAALAVPGVGPIASALLGAAAGLTAFVPGAVGIASDRWGRALSLATDTTPHDSRGNPVPGAVFEQSWLSGDAEHAPSFDVPAPPGVDPTRVQATQGAQGGLSVSQLARAFAQGGESSASTPGGPVEGGTGAAKGDAGAGDGGGGSAVPSTQGAVSAPAAAPSSVVPWVVGGVALTGLLLVGLGAWDRARRESAPA
jgi:hypothetical protein